MGYHITAKAIHKRNKGNFKKALNMILVETWGWGIGKTWRIYLVI